MGCRSVSKYKVGLLARPPNLREYDTRPPPAISQVAVLAGDYLLARASVLLARLGDVQVVEIMATALDSLVQGEIMQLKMDPEKMLDISQYLKKSYYKTASLITNACKSCAILGGHAFDSDVRCLGLVSVARAYVSFIFFFSLHWSTALY